MDDVDQRLRELARLSAEWLDGDEGRRDMARRARQARADAAVDMSAAAVDARLRELADLSALCQSLRAPERN